MRVIPDDPMTSYYLVFGLGWSMMLISLVASAYIIFTVFSRYRKDGTVGMSIRFPMYIAFTDVGMSVSLLTNQMHSVLYWRTWTGWQCKFTAAHVAFWVIANMTQTTIIAVVTYLRVVKEMHIDTGKFDWKLLSVVYGHALFWALVGIPSYGPSRYWCYQENYGENKAAGLIITGIEFVLFGITAVSFMFVLNVLQKNRSRADVKTKTLSPSQMTSMANAINSAQSSLKEKYASMETKATRKMMLYIFNFFIQWTSVVPYCFGSAFDYYPDWFYVLCTIGMNCGGLLNIISFLINETPRKTAEE
jgi:hypothetical protein